MIAEKSGLLKSDRWLWALTLAVAAVLPGLRGDCQEPGAAARAGAASRQDAAGGRAQDRDRAEGNAGNPLPRRGDDRPAEGKRADSGSGSVPLQGGAAAQPLDDARRAELQAFVLEHQPGVARMLRMLERRVPAGYQRAIESLNRDVQRLQALEKRDPELHELALGRWKVRSSIDLLLAEMALRSDSGSAEKRDAQMAQLRELVQKQEDFRRRQLRLELTRTRNRLEQQLHRSETQEVELVDRTLNELMGRVKRMKRETGGNAAPIPPAGGKTPPMTGDKPDGAGRDKEPGDPGRT